MYTVNSILDYQINVIIDYNDGVGDDDDDNGDKTKSLCRNLEQRSTQTGKGCDS
jgi:hypothetical protein